MVLALMLTFVSCSDNTSELIVEETTQEPMEEEVLEVTYSYLALGDSYTIGQGVEESSQYARQLQRRLISDEIIIDSVKVIAQTGWTTRNLITAIAQEDPGQFDLVSLLIGVNNQYRGQAFSVFEEEFIELLDTSISLAVEGKNKVFVISIPDYGVTPFGANNAEQIAEELDAYNEYMKEICAEREIPFVDITELSRMLGDGNGALATDNLHPSGYQYGKWLEEIKPAVVQLF